MNNSFIEDYSDTGESVYIDSLYALTKDIPLLIKSQAQENGLRVELQNLSKIFDKMSRAKTIDKEIEHYMTIVRTRINASKEKKEIYLQEKRAEQFIVNIGIKNSEEKKFSKASALRKEIYAVRHMCKNLKNIDIRDYMNKTYKKELSDGGYAPFTSTDICNFIGKHDLKASAKAA